MTEEQTKSRLDIAKEVLNQNADATTEDFTKASTAAGFKRGIGVGTILQAKQALGLVEASADPWSAVDDAISALQTAIKDAKKTGSGKPLADYTAKQLAAALTRKISDSSKSDT